MDEVSRHLVPLQAQRAQAHFLVQSKPRRNMGQHCLLHLGDLHVRSLYPPSEASAVVQNLLLLHVLERYVRKFGALFRGLQIFRTFSGSRHAVSAANSAPSSLVKYHVYHLSFGVDCLGTVDSHCQSPVSLPTDRPVLKDRDSTNTGSSMLNSSCIIVGDGSLLSTEHGARYGVYIFCVLSLPTYILSSIIRNAALNWMEDGSQGDCGERCHHV